MKKYSIFILFSLLYLSGFSQKINEEVAAKTALNFLSYNCDSEQEWKQYTISETYAEKEGAEILYYIFALNPTGFVIVSADERAKPIIGYSKDSPTNPNNLSPEFSFYMLGFREQLIETKSKNLVPYPETAYEWQKYKKAFTDFGHEYRPISVSPLVTTLWDQTGYYNDKCPNGNALVGCVAVAMGQIMRYFEYPVLGQSSWSYNDGSGEVPAYGTQSTNFALAPYDWYSMPNVVTSSNSETARLLYDCGVAVEMDYGTSASSAFTNDVPNGIDVFFNYTFIGTNSSVTVGNIKTELDASRPVYISGNDNVNSGHAWVCDGYDANNYFHMNWGWGGMQNGYFLLSNLTPNGNNFNSNKEYVSFQPLVGNCQGTTNLSASIASSVNLHLQSYSTITTSQLIYSGANITYDANTSVTLSPGFWAKQGVTFHAYIDGCSNAGPQYTTDIEQEELTNDSFVKIYPNPATDIINLEYDYRNIKSIEMFDMQGRKIYDIQTEVSGKTEVNINELSQGMYILRFNQSKSYKIIK